MDQENGYFNIIYSFKPKSTLYKSTIPNIYVFQQNTAHLESMAPPGYPWLSHKRCHTFFVNFPAMKNDDTGSYQLYVYLVYSSQSSMFEECIIVFQVLVCKQMLLFFEECIMVVQAPAQVPRIKMSRILLSITLNFGCSPYVCIILWVRELVTSYY